MFSAAQKKYASEQYTFASAAAVARSGAPAAAAHPA